MLEAIIAIASISLVSVFIMQMFVASSRINRLARDIDNANMISMGVIEEFKGRASPVCARGDYYEVYFDVNWDIVHDISYAEFIMKINIYTEDSYIYNILTSIFTVSDFYADGDSFVALQASKYFPG